MLAEWYFCCCINASPTNTKIFLRIWDIIRDRESDWRILSLAFQELQKTEVWTQLYLLPDVLATLHRDDVPQSTRVLVASFCKNLLEFLPSRESEPFLSLLDSAYFSTSPETIQRLKACADAISDSRGRRVSGIPYQDLKEFIAETLLLTIISDQIKNEPEISSRLSASIKESVAMGLLLENALDCQHGRMAFRLATRIANLLGYPRQYLLNGIWNSKHGAAELEPDLMQTWAEVLFGQPLTGADDRRNNRIAQQLINESITLSKLSDLSAHAGERTEQWSDVLSRIGYDSSEIAKGLSIIYWQATLWEMAADVDERASAGPLSKLWTPPGVTARRVNVHAPLPADKLAHWASQLHVLLELRGMHSEISASGSKAPNVPRHSRWAFFSPWIRLNPQRAREGGEDDFRYPTAANPVVLIRLLVGAYVAIKVLRKLQDDPERDVFAALVAHASSVLSLYRNWLRNYKTSDSTLIEAAPLKPSVTGLALFERDQIEFIGRGNIESVPPSTFLEILRQKTSKDDERPHDGQTSPDEKEFYASILPEVLMSWIASAYTGASESSRSKRWLELIPEVDRYFRSRDHNDRRKTEAALIMRYICESRRIDRDFDWRKRNWSWSIPNRVLLLTQF